jgi:hypothetical protein
MPKSVSFSVRPSWIMTFSGLTSRWTMPCACAASSAREIWSVMATATSAGSSGCWAPKSLSVGPVSSSAAM